MAQGFTITELAEELGARGVLEAGDGGYRLAAATAAGDTWSRHRR